MVDALLRVIAAGPHTTIQDGGRPGLMRFGVPASGAMDRKALRVANLALGNDPGATAIEVSLGGLVLECVSGSLTMAAAGGGFILEVDGNRLGSWTVFDLCAGQRLVVRRGPWGNWTCLACAGRLKAPVWLGSTATHGPSGFGGGALVAGRDLVVAGADLRPGRLGAITCPVSARPRPLLHAVPGPQDRCFARETLDRFATGTFHLSAAYDRMGVRLTGPDLAPNDALSIPSEPILRGSVQVSGDGVATVLLSDHQTTGGYPKIATVLGDDLDGFAQCRVGDAVRFQVITAAEAVILARQRARSTARYLAGLDRRNH